jgi:hypothetical protein
MEEAVNLDLSTMGGLNDEVRTLIKALSVSLGEDDKAAINITINMKRVEDTDHLIDVTWKVKPAYPGKSRKIIANADLVGNLTVDGTPTQRSVFENVGV